jgi:hypothetical protein
MPSGPGDFSLHLVCQLGKENPVFSTVSSNTFSLSALKKDGSETLSKAFFSKD